MMGALGAIALAGACMSSVELRGGETVAGPVVAVTRAGVQVGGDAPRTYALDRVRLLTGEAEEFTTRFESLRDTADRAWRARTRLERGDAALARPLFEELFDEYFPPRPAPGESGQEPAGPTGAVIADGVLRCRLGQADYTGAVGAWLALIGVADQYPGGTAPSIEGRLLLCPDLPPMWLGAGAPDPAVLAAGAGSATEAQTDAAELGALYRAAAAFERSGEEAAIEPVREGESAGVALVRVVVAARVGDAAQRAAAREALERRLSAQNTDEAAAPPPWERAWLHSGLGRSLLREEAVAERRRGVVELLRIPALLGPDHPYLAGLALAESARELGRQGDARAAAALRDELMRRCPSHPAAEAIPDAPATSGGAR